MGKKEPTLYSVCVGASCKCAFPQSSGILNAVFVTEDAALPALLEPGALHSCSSCPSNTCGSDGLLAAGSWLVFRAKGENVRMIKNYKGDVLSLWM